MAAVFKLARIDILIYFFVYHLQKKKKAILYIVEYCEKAVFTKFSEKKSGIEEITTNHNRTSCAIFDSYLEKRSSQGPQHYDSRQELYGVFICHLTRKSNIVCSFYYYKKHQIKVGSQETLLFVSQLSLAYKQNLVTSY